MGFSCLKLKDMSLRNKIFYLGIIFNNKVNNSMISTIENIRNIQMEYESKYEKLVYPTETVNFEKISKKDFIKYIKTDTGIYTKSKNKLEMEKIISLIWFTFLPNVEFNYKFGILGHDKHFDMSLNLNSIYESLIDSIYSYSKLLMISEIKKNLQELIFSFEELLCASIKIVSDIRAKYRTLKYLIRELEKKQTLIEHLEEEHLEEIFTIQEEIFRAVNALMELEKNLNESIIKSNFVISKAYINNLFAILNDLFQIIKNNRKSLTPMLEQKNELPERTTFNSLEQFHEYNRNNYVENYQIFLKISLPPNYSQLSYFKKFLLDVKLTFDIFNRKFSWDLVFSPFQLIQFFIRCYFESKNSRLNIEERKQEWNKKVQFRIYTLSNLKTEQANNMEVLMFLYVLLWNEKLMEHVKVKRLIHNTANTISKEEEILSNDLISIVKSNILLE
jgi:hypothetical protein